MTQFNKLAVIIPTRNRSDLAIQALRSVLQSDSIDDVVIVVSDNSTDQIEADTLSRLCKEFSGGRQGPEVFYIRPGQDLSMSDHWEWARLRTQCLASVSHFLYLTDRSVIKPWGLSTLKGLARAHPGDAISFNTDVVLDSVEPVQLRQEEWSAAVVRVRSERLLFLASELVLMNPLPRMLNTVVPESVFESILKQFGTVFSSSTAPDFALCWRLLAVVEDFLYFDRPVITMHGLRHSNGASTTTGVVSKATKDFLRMANGRAVIGADTPLPAAVTTCNVIAQEYVAVARRLGGKRLPALNQRAYMRTIAGETDGFVPGLLKTQNMAILRSTGITFGRVPAARRSIAKSLHFLTRLGPWSFAAAVQRRARWRHAPTFTNPESAIERAVHDDRRRRSSLRHLRYLAAGKALHVEQIADGTVSHEGNRKRT